ncbi:aminotransferase class I/II-fold pyridoxal phosphate-dependent enzyme [Bradyrhizobium sp. DASA03007]|uniref:aminotransferase class I/II-fold pyridoxal phosphate-dependent enzyme n=1 Tax=unclassified Bradyrhizobium TaxID=2631580 RepID=UPI003F701A82
MKSTNADRVGHYVAALHALKEDDRLRGLKPPGGIDFTSNDYLALASAPRMKKAISDALEAGTPVGAGGSRLLRGNCEEHEVLEAEAARFFGAETALFFGGGYVANFAVLTTLPQRGDLLVLDSLVHASIHEGARAGRADFRISKHNDPQSVEDTIQEWRAKGEGGRIWIVVESLYSMDGDFAPLEDLVAIVAFTHREIRARGLHSPSNSQIVPYIVGENARAMQLASRLQARGFDIRGIRPPTVPAGTARLRISLTLNVREGDVCAMLDALSEETRGWSR